MMMMQGAESWDTGKMSAKNKISIENLKRRKLWDIRHFYMN